MDVHIAKTQAEREAIYALRDEIYKSEIETPQHYSRAGQDQEDATAQLLYVKKDGQVVGAVRLNFAADVSFSEYYTGIFGHEQFRQVIPDEKMVLASRFSVHPEHRAGDAALSLIMASAQISHRRGIEAGFADCRLMLLPLYTMLGFRTYRRPCHYKYMGTLAPLLFVAGDLHHVRKVGSPLATLAAVDSPEITETARRLLAVLPKQPVILSAQAHRYSFWPPLFTVLGRPPAMRGVLAGLGEPEVRELLSRSYIIDFAPGDVVLQCGHRAWERWLVLSGDVEADKQTVSPGALIGGGRDLATRWHGVSARVGPSGARLLSIDERNLEQLRSGPSQVHAQFLANLANGDSPPLSSSALAAFSASTAGSEKPGSL
jgi:predicted GNAT family N-acyltransferase